MLEFSKNLLLFFTACYVKAKQRLSADLLSLAFLMLNDRLAGIESYSHPTNHPLNTTKQLNV